MNFLFFFTMLSTVQNRTFHCPLETTEYLSYFYVASSIFHVYRMLHLLTDIAVCAGARSLELWRDVVFTFSLIAILGHHRAICLKCHSLELWPSRDCCWEVFKCLPLDTFVALLVKIDRKPSLFCVIALTEISCNNTAVRYSMCLRKTGIGF